MTEPTKILPCPQCGSTNTLAKLRAKRAAVKKRLADQARKRYQASPKPRVRPSAGKHSHSIASHSHQTMSMSLAWPDPIPPGDLRIDTPEESGQVGIVRINDAVLDVCVDCGVFYAPNAKELGEQLETDIIELDPLGALAEIRAPNEGNSG